ncbi:SEC21 protein [Spraguea lophii 42_110]|uniref:SEC21 protein n=1 Tax=Spraguea lophii (strain 42_110) TaxID=1358809 RepID=S7WAF9_SPRLO|nr:SEC21 protein [Spraguea lophii 42_110]
MNKKLSESEILSDIRESFSRSQLVPKSCVRSICNFIQLLSSKDVSKQFLQQCCFFILRGFGSKNVYLKNILYSALQVLGNLGVEDTFLSISSLTKDIEEGKNGLKILFSILPKQMIADYQRYLHNGLEKGEKDAILVSYDLATQSIENNLIIKKLVSLKALEYGLSSNDISGYYTLGLIYEMKKNDDQYLFRLVQKKSAGYLAMGMLRILRKVFYLDRKLNTQILQEFLGSREEFVILEATKVVDSLEEDGVVFLTQTLNNLRILLRNNNPVMKIAALRVINNLSKKFPKKIELINKELERQAKNNFLVMQILLRTGTESTIDKLVEQIPDSKNLPENFKTELILVLENLSKKYPSKKSKFLELLKENMINQGSIEFKKFILKIIERNIKENQSFFIGLLSDYIEDSHHFHLTIEILGILGEEIPKNINCNKYIVHIINRLILENDKVRISALQSLHNIFIHSVNNELKNSIKKIIKSLTKDKNFEVRKTARFLYKNINTDYNIELHLEEEKIKEINFIKECKEIILSKTDVKISLVKIIHREKIILRFKISNMMEGIKISRGILKFEGNKNFDIKIDTIESGCNIIVEKEIPMEESEYNGIFTYEMFAYEDEEDIEKETLSFEPFDINIIDFIIPSDPIEKYNYKKEIKFFLPSDLFESRDKILSIFNLKIVAQDGAQQMQSMVLAGKINNSEIMVEVEMKEIKKGVNVKIELLGTDEDMVERIVNVLE